ncbi:MAG: type II CAAX endopeptidase family protein [Tahibacter sp.]
MSASLWRVLAVACGVMLIACTPLALNALSRHWVAAQLSEVAAVDLANVARTPAMLHWSLHSLDQLVARRVFDADSFQVDAEGLRVRGTRFEFGLRIARSVDLVRFSRMRVNLRSDIADNSASSTLAQTGRTLRLIARRSLDSPELATEVFRLPTGTLEPSTRWSQSLGCLRWSELATGRPVGAPDRAAMLRLRFEGPTSHTLLIDDVRLEMEPGQPLLDLGREIERVPSALSSHGGFQQAPQCSENQISAIEAVPSAPLRYPVRAIAAPASLREMDHLLSENLQAIPIYQIPQFSRAELRLAWRDHVWAVQPSAILVPSELTGATRMRALQLANAPDLRLAEAAELPAPGSLWFLSILFAALTIWLRFSRPRGDFIELGVVLLPMLLAVTTGWIGDDLSGPQLLVIGTLALYVASFAREAVPFARRIGPPGAWMAAAAITTLVVLILLCLPAHSESQVLPSASVLLRYAAWVILQQLVLCVFVYERMLRLCRGNAWLATWLCAVLFALLHTPNGGLMLATYLGALLWLPLYQRWRALPPLIFAHFSTAIALQSLAPQDWIRSAEVSLRYFF